MESISLKKAMQRVGSIKFEFTTFMFNQKATSQQKEKEYKAARG